MPDYAKMYKTLFQSQTRAIEILQKAQQDTEEMYISAPEPELRVLEPVKPEDGEPDKEGGNKMLFVKVILKILALPFILLLSLLVSFCSFLLACSGLFFGIASFIMFLLGAGVLLMGNTWAGILILVTAFLVSPFGIPLFAEWLVDKLDDLNSSVKGFVFG